MSIKNIAHESFIKVIKFHNSEYESLERNTEKLIDDENFESNVSFIYGKLDILKKLHKILDEAKKQTESL